ncbi:MAG TPA: long-chain-fatty-acid--CoA ligase [Amycolatopsis sp.]|nr:long-chain-fatty-acid--CoA ligase [Amycolatopsis sp.]
MIADLGNATLEELIRSYGRTQPGKPLATFDGRTTTYGEAQSRSNRIANGLSRCGVGEGSRVALIAKSRTETFEVLFAARKVGAVFVPVNWRLSPVEMEYVLDNSRAEFVFVSDEFADTIGQIRDRLPALRHVVSIGRSTGQPSYEDWLAEYPDIDPGHVSGAEDVALQLYSSGTTGHPKGVLLANRSVFAFYRNAERWISADPDGVHLNCLPLFHVGGINWSLQAFAQGAHVVGLGDFEPDEALGLVEKLRVTHIMTVPTVIQLLLSRPVARTTDFSSVKVIIYGGSPIPEKVLKDAIATFGNVMYGLYGMTEMSFGATLLTPPEHVDPDHPERLLSVGKPFADTELKVVDPTTGAESEPGEKGELWFRSPQLAVGYWDLPDETAAAFRPDGWYRTGDIGRQVDGYFYVTDRLKDMIISGGENIYPAEIERVLLECDAVTDVVVFAVPDEQWGETPRAEVVLTPSADVSEKELLDYVRERLARYKCPKYIGFREELPRNASGKILRHKLRAEFAQPHQPA